MADEVLKRDQNRVVVLAGVTDDAAQDIVMLRLDPTTKRLKTSAAVTSGIPTFTDNETPSGTINGSNKVFTLAANPSPAASLMLFLNGMYQTPAGEDYTLVDETKTFINAPLSGSVLRAFYRT